MTARPAIWLVALLLALPGPATAVEPGEILSDPALEARARDISKELRCLVCQNQSIADSTADLAADLREQVREMLLAGADDEAILNYMVERYGDFVRYRPAFNQRTWMLWIGPFVVFGIGLAIALVVIMRRAGAPGGAP